MIFLLLQATFASIFALVIKWVGVRKDQGKRDSIFVVGPINYIFAAIASVPMFLAQPTGAISTSAILTGAAMGAIYFIAFFLVIYCVKWSGVASTTVVGVLSILIPILFATFYWSDHPSGLQIIGIGIALFALALMGGKQTDAVVKKPWFAPLVLAGFFLLCGMSRIAQEAFKHVSEPEQKPSFTLAAFVVTAIPSTVLLAYLLIIRKHKLALTEIAFGVAMGASNFAQTFLILKCLEYYKGYIVFPVTSAGCILITTLLATRCFGEQINRRTYAGISLAVFALFLLNGLPD